MTIDDYLKSDVVHRRGRHKWSYVGHADLLAWQDDMNSCLDAIIMASTKIKLLEAQIAELMR